MAVDGSTLDGVLRTCGVLREGDGPVLAGRIASLLDVVTKLPRAIWYEADSTAHDQRIWDRIVSVVSAGMLLILDMGCVNYTMFDRLTTMGVSFITRIKANASYHVVQVLHAGDTIRDEVIRLGSTAHRCEHEMRLVAVRRGSCWYQYFTNVTDPRQSPVVYVAALYWQRWHIEDAFTIVKRLLGLAYFWSGSLNAIKTHIWATWIVYAVLVDVTDAVAEALHQPMSALSMEMVYRGLYHYTHAYHRGEAQDVVAYLAADAHGLGIIKRKRHSALFEQFVSGTLFDFPKLHRYSPNSQMI